MNIVIILKSKIGSADDILPVLMEIDNRFQGVDFLFVFPDLKTYEVNLKNHELWEFIQSLNPKIFIAGGENKIRTFSHMFSLLFYLIFKRNVFFKFRDRLPGHKRFMGILKILSKTIEIKCYMPKFSLRGIKNHALESSLSKKLKNPQPKDREVYDYFLSTVPLHILNNPFGHDIPKEKFVKMGYARKLPPWQKNLARMVKKNKIVQKGNYYLYTMSGLTKRAFNEPDRQEVFEETLTVLKAFEKDIKAVFKPHAVTGIDRLEESIKRVGLTNYVIDYSHAMVLAYGAKFVISYNYSNTHFDAHYLGIPIIEYNALDPKLLELYGGWSIGGKICDFFINRDPEELNDILTDIIKNGLTVKRDREFIDRNFPKTHANFYQFLDQLCKEASQ